MITPEEREKAPDLFKEALEVWAEAKAQLAIRGTGRGREVKARPEVQLSGTLLEALYRLGLDVNVADAVALNEYQDAKERYVAEWIGDVSYLQLAEWSGFVAATDSLVEKLELALKKLWNRALGKHPAQPRFRLPEPKAGLYLAEIVAGQKELMRRHLRDPGQKSENKKTDSPLYVVVLEAGYYTAKSDEANRTVRLEDNSQYLMNLIVARYLEVLKTIPHISNAVSILDARKRFLEGPPVTVTYDQVERYFREVPATKEAEKAQKEEKENARVKAMEKAKLKEALAILRGRTHLDKAAKAAIRQRIKTFNDEWRDLSDAPETAVLVRPGKAKGVWRWQTPLFLPPKET
jgi:hypothetical protein